MSLTRLQQNFRYSLQQYPFIRVGMLWSRWIDSLLNISSVGEPVDH